MFRTVLNKTLIILIAFSCLPLSAQVRVVASIMPFADWARNIGGPHVAVSTVLRPGESPHTFAPGPRRMLLLSKADLFIEAGFGLEYWADKMIRAAGKTNLKRLVLAGLVKIPIRDDAEPPGTADGGGPNPHIWLSVRNAIVFCGAIRDELSRLDPVHATEFTRNCLNYTKILELLDKRYGDTLRTRTVREFVCFHPAYVYLERDYGLRHVAIEEIPGRNPSARQVADVVNTIRRLGLKTVFIEPQLDPRVGLSVAKETGAAVETLDPEGGAPGRETYIGLMEFNLAQLVKALPGPPVGGAR